MLSQQLRCIEGEFFSGRPGSIAKPSLYKDPGLFRPHLCYRQSLYRGPGLVRPPPCYRNIFAAQSPRSIQIAPLLSQKPSLYRDQVYSDRLAALGGGASLYIEMQICSDRPFAPQTLRCTETQIYSDRPFAIATPSLYRGPGPFGSRLCNRNTFAVWRSRSIKAASFLS